MTTNQPTEKQDDAMRIAQDIDETFIVRCNDDPVPVEAIAAVVRARLDTISRLPTADLAGTVTTQMQETDDIMEPLLPSRIVSDWSGMGNQVVGGETHPATEGDDHCKECGWCMPPNLTNRRGTWHQINCSLFGKSDVPPPPDATGQGVDGMWELCRNLYNNLMHEDLQADTMALRDELGKLLDASPAAKQSSKVLPSDEEVEAYFHKHSWAGDARCVALIFMRWLRSR